MTRNFNHLTLDGLIDNMNSYFCLGVAERNHNHLTGFERRTSGIKQQKNPATLSQIFPYFNQDLQLPARRGIQMQLYIFIVF